MEKEENKAAKSMKNQHQKYASKWTAPLGLVILLDRTVGSALVIVTLSLGIYIIYIHRYIHLHSKVEKIGAV